MVPILTFFSPSFISLFGVSPCWVVLWLLPWSLKKGEFSAVFAALLFGLLLDGISLSGASHVPILIILGFWWGRLGRKGSQIKQSFLLGLLSWVGTLLFGLSLWFQTILIDQSDLSFVFWGLHTLLAQSFITALFAPLLCSWMLLILRSSKSV